MDTQSPRFKAKLGLFVAAGFFLFMVGIFLIGKQKNLFNPVFKLVTSFHNVSGLQVGNTIRLSGINVGTVDNIVIVNDSTIRVDMVIKKDVQRFIKTDCIATISSEGIIGDRVVVITHGSATTHSVRPGQYLNSMEPIEIESIISSLSVTADNFEVISDQLAEIMFKINNGEGVLGRLIQDSTMSENIKETIINLKKSSKGLDENMNAAKHNFLLKGYFRKKAKAAEKLKQDNANDEDKTKK